MTAIPILSHFLNGHPMSDTNRASGNLLNIANILTLLRLLLALVVFFTIRLADTPGGRPLWYLIGLAIFMLALATDWLDGFVARRFNLETTFGRVADPFVDKLLVCGTFMLFAICLNGNPYLTPEGERYLANVAPWMVMVIVGREFLISALRGFAESRNIKFGANFWGKQKMVFQSVAICAVFLHQAVLYTHFAFALLTTVLIWLAVGWTLLSGVLYIFRARRVLANEPA